MTLIPGVTLSPGGKDTKFPIQPGVPLDFYGNPLGALPSNLLPVFNVKVYGAKGDGSTDDTTAIQATLAAAGASGGIAYFPAGVFMISAPLAVPSNVTVAGAGIGSTTIRITPTAGPAFAFAYILQPPAQLPANSTNVVVRDLTVDGNLRGGVNGGSQGGGVLPGNSWSCYRVHADDCNYFGFFLGSITSVLLEDCQGSRGGGADCIGGGSPTLANARIVRFTWNANLANRNRIDLAGGSDVTVAYCRDFATSTGSLIFEGVTQSRIVNNTLGCTISVHSDSGYSPTTYTEPLEISIIGNRVSNTLTGTQGILLTFDRNTAHAVNKGGYNVVAYNTVAGAALSGILLDGEDSSNSFGHTLCVGNVIRNPNNDGAATQNTGYNICAPSGINAQYALNAVIANNQCIDDRGTAKMRYGIQVGGASAAAPVNTGVCVFDNDVSAGLDGTIGVQSTNAYWVDRNAGAGADSSDVGRVDLAADVQPGAGTNNLILSSVLQPGTYQVSATVLLDGAASTLDYDFGIDSFGATVTEGIWTSVQPAATTTAVSVCLSGLIVVTAAGTIQLACSFSGATTATVKKLSLNIARAATQLSWRRVA